MEYGELEPVPDHEAVAMTAMSICAEAAAEAACLRQVPELADVADDREYMHWHDLLRGLDDDDWTAEILAEDCRVLDADEDSDAWGYVETERGAVFTGFPWDVANDEGDDEDEDE
jgi:hypothetical protein